MARPSGAGSGVEPVSSRLSLDRTVGRRNGRAGTYGTLAVDLTHRMRLMMVVLPIDTCMGWMRHDLRHHWPCPALIVLDMPDRRYKSFNQPNMRLTFLGCFACTCFPLGRA